jgi:hypothetical protein
MNINLNLKSKRIPTSQKDYKKSTPKSNPSTMKQLSWEIKKFKSSETNWSKPIKLLPNKNLLMNWWMKAIEKIEQKNLQLFFVKIHKISKGESLHALFRSNSKKCEEVSWKKWKRFRQISVKDSKKWKGRSLVWKKS